jgi:two-component system chemotaxis sensor kinase CheA
MDDLSQYLDLYVQTAKEYIQSLNASLLVLEKNPQDKTAIEDIFRNAHSLKSQSAAMDFTSTGYLCHVVEDVFYEIKQGRKAVTPELADELFAAFDGLGVSVSRIETESHEADLSQLAEKIKSLSGVDTEGAGKSRHAEAAGSETPAATSDPSVVAAPAIPSAEPPAAAAQAAGAAGSPATETTIPPASAPVSAPSPQPAAESGRSLSTIAVKVSVLDEMMNLLENLLVERLKLKRVSSVLDDSQDLQDYFNASEKILADLQFQIMKARAVPVSLVFDHFPRAVRDLARAENKDVTLEITGSDLELDRTIVDHLDEPLIHLLRNAVSHGIAAKGKIKLSAERQKEYAQITVADDGQGIDWPLVAQKAGLPPTESDPKRLREALFSGISTSTTVTQISGRGVGLAAIKKMVDDFGGTIDVSSQPAKGTAFTIKLPLTLAIAKALVIRVDQRHFAIPTLAVERIASLPAASIKKVAGQEAMILEESDIPLLRLHDRLNTGAASPTTTAATSTPAAGDLLVVIVDEGGERLGLIVDAVIETTDIVIKPVPPALKGVRGFSGVTILSDGKTALIINPKELQ